MKVYFDNAASTRVREEAVDAVVRVMRENFGNPSSLHDCGRRAKTELDNARNNIAFSLGTKPDNIFLTSGGTEANNWAVFGAADVLSRRGKHIITSAVEHSAVLDPIKKLESKGWDVTYLMPDENGRISCDSFTDALRDDTVFASVMLVNNETGIVNPIGEFSNIIKKHSLKIILHTDAIQGLCKIPFTVSSIGADLITVSSHKIHGPKGAGALYIKDGVKLAPFILGGNHEKGIRGGTEGLPAAVGFGEAARLGVSELDDTISHVYGIRKHISDRLRVEIPSVVFITDEDSSACEDYFANHIKSQFILPISLPGHMSEVLMTFLDGEGICVSRSAACKKGARSRTLEAMKMKNDVIDGALRVSFSRYNTLDEAEYFVQMLKKASETLLKKM